MPNLPYRFNHASRDPAELGRLLVHELESNSGRYDDAYLVSLIERGAAVNAEILDGSTALMLASVDGRADVVRALITHGADLDAQNSYGNTALMLAVNRGREAVVQLLVDGGAALEIENDKGVIPIQIKKDSQGDSQARR